MGNVGAPAWVPDHCRRQALAESEAKAWSAAAGYQQVEHLGIVAMIVAEGELSQIERQILPGEMMKAAHHAALEQGPEGFDAVGVDYALYVFMIAMADNFMWVFGFELAIGGMLVSGQQCHAGRNHLTNKAIECTAPGIRYGFGDDLPFTADSADYRHLTRCLTPGLMAAFMPVAVLVLAPNIGFVYFDDAQELLELIIIHRAANPPAHRPGGFVARRGGEYGALDLQGAHALLGVQHQQGDGEPGLERILGVLEHRASNQREAIALFGALMALPVPRLRKLIDLGGLTARALDFTPRPPMLQEKQFTGVFAREELVQVAQLDHPEQFSDLYAFC
jgi:hypothetical protein